MLSNPVSQTMISQQLQVQAQSYLEQARLQKNLCHLEMALALYDQAKVTFRHAQNTYLPVPSLAAVKDALTQARAPQTAAEDALRQRIAEVYFERGELLTELKNFVKAKASYTKAKEWGHLEAEDRLHGVTQIQAPERATASSFLNRLENHATPQSIDEKSALVDYLFTKTLLILKRLDISKQAPGFFLVYAHDNHKQGMANASTAKYFIEKLSTLKLNLYSDQTPTGQPCFSTPEDIDDGQIENILTSQLCLLPTGWGQSQPVNKVIVCCSEVLGRYLKQWGENGQYYKDYCHKLEVAYDRACKEQSDQALREVIEIFSKQAPYQAGFHHVLTEIAFLQIRAKVLGSEHGIIPVSLTQNAFQQCLGEFIETTAVRIGDIPRFEEQAKQGKVIYPNQSRHWTLFKLIERLLTRNHEAKLLFDKFWDGYSTFITDLKRTQSAPQALEFAERLDSIFGEIEAELHRELVLTVQQTHKHLLTLNADPRFTLKTQYLDTLKQDQGFQETLQLYVHPRGKIGRQATDSFSLLSTVETLLKDKQVILITGDSGAGKTTFNRLLEKQLWDQKKAPDAIPLFISLALIDKPEHDLIPKALRKRGLSEFQIHILKKEKQRFVFILDGYDESRQTQNLYMSNSINQSGSWQGQMVISCRSEYLGQDYQSRFQPISNLRGANSSFQEVVIEPFSEEERTQYLEKYVEHIQTGWAVQQYQEALEQPYLKVLISTPFLLRVVLEALPYLQNEGEERTAIRLRMDLYDQFVKQWFERNQQRLSIQGLTGTKREIFRELCDDGFVQHGIGFVKKLAVHLYTKNEGKPVINYSLFKDKGNWKDVFFGREEEKQLLREAWPLSRNGYQYRFIHKLLLEYFVARALFDSFDESMSPVAQQRRDKKASFYDSVAPSQTVQDVLLAPDHWVSDLGVVRWLTERVQQDKAFKEQLLAIINRSKIDAGVCQEAANAMTILVRAGVQFNGENLKGIRIPGADLSYGVFDHTQFDNADLSEVTLRGAWLNGATLLRANLKNVEFGEMPALNLGGWPNVCRYSPDGSWLAVGIGSKGCYLYEVEKTALELKTKIQQKLEFKYKLAFKPSMFGARSVGYDIAFSPDNKWLASADYDGAIRLWSVETGALERMFKHSVSEDSKEPFVSSISFFKNAQWLASGSYDKTIKLWRVQADEQVTIEPASILEAHSDAVQSIAVSSDNEWLASGSKDKTVKLWKLSVPELSVPEITLSKTLIEYDYAIHGVCFSADNKWLACGAEGGAVMLWKLGSTIDSPPQILKGHSGMVRSVAFSPDSNWLASGGSESAVKLWKLKDSQDGLPHVLEGHTSQMRDVSLLPSSNWLASGGVNNVESSSSEALLHRTFAGHTAAVRGVSFAPDGDWLASVSHDGTLKLWALRNPRQMFEGHTGKVLSLSVSKNGTWFASGGSDKTVRLWELEGKSVLLRQTLAEHSKGVLDVALSQNGKWLISGSGDKTVKLWKLTDSGDAELHQTLEGHSCAVFGVAISSNNRWLVSSGGKTVKLWKLSDEEASPPLCQTFECDSDNQRRVAISSDGTWVASGSGSDDGDGSSGGRNLELWKLAPESGEEPLHQILGGHSRDVFSVSFSLDDKWLASGSFDCTVKLWELSDTGASVRHTFMGHTWEVFSLSFSPDSRWLASGGADQTIKLWSLDTGECEMTIQSFIRDIFSIAWQNCTENSARIIVGGDENTIRIFQLERSGNDWKSSLSWTSYQYGLSVEALAAQGALNLSPQNKRLIEQSHRNMNVTGSLQSTISNHNKGNVFIKLMSSYINWRQPKTISDTPASEAPAG